MPTFSALAGMVLIGLVASACRSPSQNVAPGITPTPRPATVSVTKVTRSDLNSTLSYSGSVQASTVVNVVPKTSGRIETLKVDVGSVVHAGDVIATLDSATLQAQLAQAEAGVVSAQAHLDQMKAGPRSESVGQAQANLDTAQQRLAALQDGPRSENVGQAKANLDAAKAKLAQLKAGPTQDQIKAAQLSIEQAKDSLNAANVQKDGSCNPRNPQYMCDSAQASAFAAQTAVQQAQQQLKILTAPPTKEALAQAQAAVDAAQQQYDLAKVPYTSHDIAEAKAAVSAAEDQLKLAEKPYTAADIKVAEASVAQAQAAVDLAKIQLNDANITAPVDGVVSQKLLDVGAMAGPTSPIVSIISKKVEVGINVEESKLGLVTLGEKAIVTAPAFPGVTFPASVIAAPPTVDPKSRTALVRLAPVDPKGQLKPGMFAQVSLVAQHLKNVLVVPQSAIVNNNGQTFVYLVNNGVIKVQAVSVGVSDNNNVEIVSGLSEGQTVVIGDKPTLRDGDRVTPQVTGR